MNKRILAAVLFASLNLTMASAHALDIDPEAQNIIDSALINECNIVLGADSLAIDEAVETSQCNLDLIMSTAINDNPNLAESLVAAAISSLGANTFAAENVLSASINALGLDSPLIANILRVAIEAGVNTDTVTAIAIASGVDATIASEATAAGAPSVAVNNNANATSSQTNAGGGGGGAGISNNQ
jgi:hypothetical protein